jgi:hypothetical protein
MDLPETLRAAGKGPVRGRWYRLLYDIGEGPGMIPAVFAAGGVDGVLRQMQVLEVCDPEVFGVGDFVDQAVLCRWMDVASGRPVERRMSFSRDQFLDAFAVGEKPAEFVAWVKEAS